MMPGDLMLVDVDAGRNAPLHLYSAPTLVDPSLVELELEGEARKRYYVGCVRNGDVVIVVATSVAKTSDELQMLVFARSVLGWCFARYLRPT